jgi:glycosyltransferase involved in cell wall biosynthesis
MSRKRFQQDKLHLSIVVPCYNEEIVLPHLFVRLHQVVHGLGLSYEIICVNDGSQDTTLATLVEFHQSNPQIKVINLSRNFGKEIALTAGIDFATGQVVVPIDADLQDPPELIGSMIKQWQEGYDIVVATRRFRHGESWLKKITATAFYRIIGAISTTPIPSETGDFRLLDRKVVDAIKRLPERTRFMKGIFVWVGFQHTSILYDRDQRYQGQTKWNYWKLWQFAMDGIASFSQVPLKIWTYIGFLIASFAFLYASFLIIRTLIFGVDVPGYASLMVTALFLGGVQLLTLGIIGEYVGRIYEEVKQRPLYLVRDCYGFDDSDFNNRDTEEQKQRNSLVEKV